MFLPCKGISVFRTVVCSYNALCKYSTCKNATKRFQLQLQEQDQGRKRLQCFSVFLLNHQPSRTANSHFSHYLEFYNCNWKQVGLDKIIVPKRSMSISYRKYKLPKIFALGP